MDALSCTEPLRINFDLQLTLIASSLYSLLGQRVGEGLNTARCNTVFHKLVRASATIDIRGCSIEVRIRRRAKETIPAGRQLRSDAPSHPLARRPRSSSDSP